MFLMIHDDPKKDEKDHWKYLLDASKRDKIEMSRGKVEHYFN